MSCENNLLRITTYVSPLIQYNQGKGFPRIFHNKHTLRRRFPWVLSICRFGNELFCKHDLGQEKV